MLKLLLFTLALFGATEGKGQTSADLATQASAAYDAGDFDGAIALYEKAADAGLSNGHLYYNLGIAYYRANKLGAAMAAFLGARSLLPRDPDIQANLKFVGAKIHDRLETERAGGIAGVIGFWLDHFTPREYAYAAAILMAVTGIFLSLTSVIPSLQRARPAAFATFTLPFVVLASLLIASARHETWGAVTVTNAQVRAGPGDKHPVLFELGEGAPFVAEERDTTGANWVRVSLSDGKKGWIPLKDVKVF